MQTLGEWLGMGGYAVYVWSSYGLAVMILGLNIWMMTVKKNRVWRQVREWLTESGR